MFENKEFEGIYYSRFVASWINGGGRKIDWAFKSWLRTLTINDQKIPDDIIEEIYNYGSNGKLELEMSTQKFIQKYELRDGAE